MRGDASIEMYQIKMVVRSNEVSPRLAGRYVEHFGAHVESRTSGLQRLSVDVNDGDGGAGLDECFGNRGTDAAGATSNKGVTA